MKGKREVIKGNERGKGNEEMKGKGKLSDFSPFNNTINVLIMFYLQYH